MIDDLTDWLRSLRPSPPKPGRGGPPRETQPVVKTSVMDAVADGYRERVPSPTGAPEPPNREGASAVPTHDYRALFLHEFAARESAEAQLAEAQARVSSLENQLRGAESRLFGRALAGL